jgi:hypothetical protein
LVIVGLILVRRIIAFLAARTCQQHCLQRIKNGAIMLVHVGRRGRSTLLGRVSPLVEQARGIGEKIIGRMPVSGQRFLYAHHQDEFTDLHLGLPALDRDWAKLGQVLLDERVLT